MENAQPIDPQIVAGPPPAPQEQQKPLTRRMADFYCTQMFGRKAHIRYNPMWSSPYHVEMRQRGAPPILVGQGYGPREALLDAVNNTSPKADVVGAEAAPAPEAK